jgi:AcrR family transcriptional regulator
MSWVTNLVSSGTTAPGGGKRERLVGAACDLVYRRGAERMTLADIARTADVPLGNVYYYFKTKDDIFAAVVQARVDELESGFATLEHTDPSPQARLKALVGIVTEQAEVFARFGCPYGNLCSDLARRGDPGQPSAARLMQVLLDWTERQFRGMGRHDAPELAVDFVAAYQGIAVLTSALGQPELMARQARRIIDWIDALATPADGTEQQRKKGPTGSGRSC